MRPKVSVGSAPTMAIVTPFKMVTGEGRSRRWSGGSKG